MEIEEEDILYLNTELFKLMKTDYNMFELHLATQKKKGVCYYGSLEIFNVHDLKLPEFLLTESSLTIEKCEFNKYHYPSLIQSENGNIRLENLIYTTELNDIEFNVKNGELTIINCDFLESINCKINANRIIIMFSHNLKYINYHKVDCNVYILDGPLQNCNGLPEDEYDFDMGD